MATSITGTVNVYKTVSAVSDTTHVVVNNTTSLAVGDKILIIQMQGVTIDETNTSSYGTITAYNNCGNYEFDEIKGIVSTTIELKYGLLNSYTTSGRVQLIKVPSYVGDVNVDGIVTCPVYGATVGIGGVIVFECSGVLTLNANIVGTGVGFGQAAVGTGQNAANFQTPWYFWVPGGTLPTQSKGMGLYEGDGRAQGRGKYANGGGSGVVQYYAAGGGNEGRYYGGGCGGGNYGAGGNASWTSQAVSPYTDSVGTGGQALDYSTPSQRIFMGGGGGNAHVKTGSLVVARGKAGGAIIIIKAAAIVGNGGSIISNGNNSVGDYGWSGGGGGGGGGTVLLNATTFTNLTVSVNGGNGAHTRTNTGPGGGGGGGIILHNAASTPFTATYAGGVKGLQNGTTYHGAEDGASGTIVGNFIIPSKVPADSGDDCAFMFVGY